MSGLAKEPRGLQLWLWVIGFLALDLVYIFAVVVMFDHYGITLPEPSRARIPINYFLPIFLIGAAFFEECMFRLPLAVMVEHDWTVSQIALGVLGLSTVFGLLHGGILNILVQGVSGLLYSVLFLKCGGYQGRIGKPILCSTAVHFLFNASISAAILAGGGTEL